ncbi:MAG: hypothetical protein M1826_005953 [Phylliscum demangeonii]|nr:MAG: hypothetical protein M1826_005953 [Phylliscum demangeonii]
MASSLFHLIFHRVTTHADTPPHSIAIVDLPPPPTPLLPVLALAPPSLPPARLPSLPLASTLPSATARLPRPRRMPPAPARRLFMVTDPTVVCEPGFSPIPLSSSRPPGRLGAQQSAVEPGRLTPYRWIRLVEQTTHVALESSFRPVPLSKACGSSSRPGPGSWTDRPSGSSRPQSSRRVPPAHDDF